MRSDPKIKDLGLAIDNLDGGAGSGEINYITNSDAEVNTNDWTATGSATIVQTTTVGEVLRGTASFKLASTGAGTVYTDFTLDEGDEQKLLKLAFDLKALGTYAEGEWTVKLIKDPDDTPVDITVGTPDIPASQGQYTSSWSSSDVDTYRLIFTCVGSTDGISIDNVIVGPGSIVTGAAIGPWVDVTSDFTIANVTATADHLSVGTVDHYKWRRVGENMEVSFRLSGASPGGGGASSDEIIIKLPVSDLTPVLSGEIVGVGSTRRVVSDIPEINTGAWAATAIEARSTGVVLRRDETTWNGAEQIVQRVHINSSCEMKFMASIPIAEWAGSGTVNLINDNMTSANARSSYYLNNGSSNLTLALGANIILWDTANVSSNDYDTATGIYTIPADGVYRIESTARILTTTHDILTQIQVGGTIVSNMSMGLGAVRSQAETSIILELTAGQEVRVSINNNSGTTTTMEWGSTVNAFIVTRLADYSAGSAAGFGLATATSAGLIPATTPQTALTFSSTHTGWTVQRAVGVAYSDTNGVWRLKFNISALVDTGTTRSATIDGVTFASGYTLQSINVFGDIAGSRGRASAGSGVISLEHSTTQTNFICSGDVELDSKPTWA